jgi:CrcB protein
VKGLEESNVLTIVLVGVGGFLGSVLRYLMGGWVHRALDNPWFPYGTLFVNLIGCLIIGFLGGLTENRQVFTPETRLFLFLGVLGGFTTFSSFAYETSAFLNDGQFALASLNVGLQVILGLVAVWSGGCLSRLM